MKQELYPKHNKVRLSGEVISRPCALKTIGNPPRTQAKGHYVLIALGRDEATGYLTDHIRLLIDKDVVEHETIKAIKQGSHIMVEGRLEEFRSPNPDAGNSLQVRVTYLSLLKQPSDGTKKS